jgi:hypothetical protein
MRGLYAHVSQTMRTELTGALQSRWEDSLRARAAIAPHSRVPLLDQLLAPYRAPAEPLTASGGRRQAELKLISQIPPTHERKPTAALS